MKKNCGCSKPCGCGDTVLKTPPVCPPTCENGDPCPETFDAKCVIYTGDSIANLNILNGMNMSDILQLISIAITNSGCIYPGSPCMSAIGFYSTIKTSTSISVKWLAATGVSSYQVEYRLTTSPTWISNSITTNLTDSIGPLLPNSSYYIRVKSICGPVSCNSLTILVTTKP